MRVTIYYVPEYTQRRELHFEDVIDIDTSDFYFIKIKHEKSFNLIKKTDVERVFVSNLPPLKERIKKDEGSI